MPIVTLTEDSKPRYYAVTEGHEIRLDAVVSEYKLSDSSNREYAEHELRREYLRRLTEHAYECALLAHLVLNPPDDEDDLLGNLQATDRLAEKVAKDAVWLRTYDPFSALIAEVVEEEKYGTGLLLSSDRDGEKKIVGSLHDDDSWSDSERALRLVDPWWRDELARREMVKADEEERAARKYPPAAQKRLDKARDEFLAAVEHATKADKRSEKTVANKTIRRAKRKARS